MKTPILTMLQKFRMQDTRFCMPGHKGRLPIFQDLARFDVTELEKTDNLYAPNGVIAESQALFANEQGASNACYSINGSSACVAAALCYLNQGDQVLVARDFHVSCQTGLLLSGVQPIYIEVKQRLGEVPALPEEKAIFQAIAEHPKAKALYLTSPNYYGQVLDVARIAKAAHEMGMLVIVDGAHGAHFPYSPLLPLGLGQAGADIWCVSLHKTLPAANQTAALLASARVDLERLKSRLNWFQTTSPSYLLLASIDYARGVMAERGAEAIQNLRKQIRIFEEKLGAGPFKLVATDDFTRLVVNVENWGGTGWEAARLLEERGVYVEGADSKHLLLIATIQDRREDFLRLAGALSSLPPGRERATLPFAYTLGGETTLSLLEAEAQKGKWVSWREAPGKVLKRSIFSYPPGVPLVLAGQRLTEDVVKILASMEWTGYNLLGTHGGPEILEI